jgi:hypothetical protein
MVLVVRRNVNRGIIQLSCGGSLVAAMHQDLSNS